jgi:hypothetical protein
MERIHSHNRVRKQDKTIIDFPVSKFDLKFVDVKMDKDAKGDRGGSSGSDRY